MEKQKKIETKFQPLQTALSLWRFRTVFTIESCQPSWIQAGAGSLGSLQHSSSGLGKKSQAVPASLSVKYLGNGGGDLFKMQIHTSRVKPGNLHCY